MVGESRVKFLLVFALLLVGAGAGGLYVGSRLGLFQAPGAPVTFVVEKGENLISVGKRLDAAGIVHNGRTFRWYVNYLATHKKLKRGEFALNKNMSVPALVRALTEGKPIEYKFTVPEGENLFQIAEALEAKGLAKRHDFLAAARAPDVLQTLPGIAPQGHLPRSIEGYVFPDTYMLQKVFSPKEIAQIFVARFREVYHQVEPELKGNAIVNEFHFTPHQVITLASIVEKETGAADERPLVASIFVNRLRKHMRLQTDPTVIYGIWLANGSWDGKIHRSDLDTPNDYNTYQMDGLPPGPIASPGLNAIKSVLNPANSEYLYFVSKNDGTHVFSKDYSTHQKAVQTTQLDPKAREGKSWRNLPAEKRAH
jgi:UPF0755 protein